MDIANKKRVSNKNGLKKNKCKLIFLNLSLKYDVLSTLHAINLISSQISTNFKISMIFLILSQFRASKFPLYNLSKKKQQNKINNTAL